MSVFINCNFVLRHQQFIKIKRILHKIAADLTAASFLLPQIAQLLISKKDHLHNAVCALKIVLL